MRREWLRVVGIMAVCCVVCGGAGTETQGQYVRRTPIVEAAQKTRASIVSVKAEKEKQLGPERDRGTGVIVDERGYVVTNSHVIASADRVTVRLADGSELVAATIADDASHDLAVLHVESKRKLSALAIETSADLLVGETVIAIGHPFGYSNTVSTGIVSGLGREVTMPGGEVLRDLIQTNASINPGNSGGPLLNINGEWIGINVAVRDGAQGIAFALSADQVQQALSRQLSAARIAGVTHGLKVSEKTLGENDPGRQQVVVKDAAGAAYSAGLRRGDALLKVGGRTLGNRFDLERACWDGKPGQELACTVLREGKELTLSLTLGRAPEPKSSVAKSKTESRELTAPGTAVEFEVGRQSLPYARP